MSPQDFIAKWGPGGPAFDLNERQGAQPHFIDLCQLLGVPLPGSTGDYIFEQDTLVLGEARGYADVFKRNHFAWENKAPGKNLDAALKQLLTYSLALSNPPLLVVCDRLTIRIHTQFNGHPSEVHTVLLAELDQPEKQALLRRVWLEPERFRPQKTSRDITEAAAKSFATLADGLRRRGHEANRVAHFLTQCLFCFFAEDVGLLPKRMFEGLVTNKQLTSDKLTHGLANLFTAMQAGGLYGNDDIPWFNGGLFKRIDVPPLTIMEVTELRNAAALNWSAIDVSIFGTLFERGLDPAKRSQLGAHYTDPATIDRIIDPVLRRPLLQQWELVAQQLRALQAKITQKKRAAYSAGGRHYKATKGDETFQQAERLFYDWLDTLKNYRILDPACGSGNFLFMGLKALKDIEHKSHLDAAELARVTVWIGELQWRLAHGYEFKTNPVLEPLDHIECRDALLRFPVAADLSEDGPNSEGIASAGDTGARAGQMPGAHTLRFLKSPPTSAPPTPLNERIAPATLSTAASEADGARTLAEQDMGSDPNSAHNAPQGDDGIPELGSIYCGVTEAIWPQANIVIGNPPFLGDRKMIRELGENYTFTLRRVYEGRVPSGADLVCYWLLATNSIRGGANRKVLDAICKTSRIFEAWSDEGWVNEGAAVRVSLVAFGDATQVAKLDDEEVTAIAADLTAHDLSGLNDLTNATKLPENTSASFIGTQKNGPFEISGELARLWLRQPNPHGLTSAKVLRPWVNGMAVTRRAEDLWVIDFDKMSEADACLFELPFTKVVREVKPTRLELRRDWHRLHGWCHGDPRPAMKLALRGISRQIISPRVSKYRVFAWFSSMVLADSAVVTIARADDTTFGILHSRFHELWSLRMGTSLEDRPRYTPTTCFETFPFPDGLTPADTAHQRTETLPDGTVIPADIYDQNVPLDHTEYAIPAINNVTDKTTKNQLNEAGVVRMSGPISKSEAYEALASAPLPPAHGAQRHTSPKNANGTHHPQTLRQTAIAIAQAAKRLNDLRENWLNPPEWTHKVPEIIPLGMERSPYPDRIEPRPNLPEADLKALQKRTLTNLYNAKPAWLAMAHHQLDKAVAAAYGWPDYDANLPDDDILKRLLALNLARSATISPKTQTAKP